MHTVSQITYFDDLSAPADNLLLHFEGDAVELAILRRIVHSEGILCHVRGDGGIVDLDALEVDIAEILFAAE